MDGKLRGLVVNILRIVCCAAVFIAVAAFAALADEPKLALIITNKEYPASIGALENTHRDGERMAAVLTTLGFNVVHRRDLDKAAMIAAVAEYIGRLEGAGPEAIGFFYYAGHGAANSKYGENYLIPVGAPIVSDTQLPLQGVKLGEIINSIAATSVKANFVVFDACRNVPMSFSVRSAARGLRPEAHRPGILIAFATDPGKTASDEGVYAEALTEEMQKPGMLATEVFRAVRARVLRATENQQFPWIEDGLIENMYFKPPSLAVVRPPSPLPSPPPLTLFTPPRPPDPVKATDLFNLAYKYDMGKDVAQDKVEAARLYRKAGDLGDLSALYNLGLMYENGEGITQDKAEAARLYRRAADRGHAAAFSNLGVLYENGDGVEQSKAEAIKLYRKAADLGNAIGMTNLAYMYETGDGIAQNKSEAARLYRKAADLGYARAVNNLGHLYEVGAGVKQDKAEAVRYYRKAADLGNAVAMNNLGAMYAVGQGVKQDTAEAIRLYRQAADLGNVNAIYNLGKKYETGDGVGQDKAQAAQLYRKAA